MDKSYDDIYFIHDRYMIRNSVLPLESYNVIFNNDLYSEESLNKFFWDKIKDNNFFLEAIKIASSDTYNAILKAKKNNKVDIKLLLTLMKYFLRMSGRATPFGLFSGVSDGIIDKNTNLEIKNREIKKNVRLDMKWLESYLKLLEGNDSFILETKVKRNNSCYVYGNRLINPYQIENDYFNSTSIRYTKLVSLVLEKTEDFISINELIEIIIEHKFTNEISKALDYIKSLIINNYLISELIPPLINENQFEYLRKIVEKYKLTNSVEYLNNIKCLIYEYEKAPIGYGIKILDKLIKEMKQVVKVKNYLQVDLKTEYVNNYIDKNLISELKKNLTNIIFTLYQKNYDSELIRFKSDFLEKYGYNTEVSIIDLVDVNIGIPISEEFLNHRLVINDKKTKIENLLINKLVNNQKDYIEITDKDLENFKQNKLEINLEDFPDTFEIMTSIYRSENKETYEISIDSIGESFSGRFLGILPNLYKQKNEIKNYNKDTVIVELVEDPSNYRAANVMINKTVADYQLVGYTNPSNAIPSISYKDIYIGLDRNNNFYFKSLSLGKKIKIQTNHMLTFNAGSRIYKLIRILSNQELFSIGNIFQQFSFSNALYMPAIVYKNIILNQAHWYIPKTKEENSEKVIREFCDKYNVSKFVYIVEGDNKLLINLNNRASFELLINYYKKSDSGIFLRKAKESINDYIVHDIEGNHYVSEFIFTFYKNNYTNEKKMLNNGLITKSDYSNNKTRSWKCDYKRNIFMEENWIYIKIYNDSFRIEELIGDKLKLFFDKNNFIKEGFKYFFIRYSDKKNHIRLRIKCPDKNNMYYFLSIFNDWVVEMKKTGLINSICIETYEREIERYGGIEAIEYAETYFCSESTIIQNIFKENMLKREKVEKDKAGIMVLILMMKAWGFDTIQAEDWLSNSVDKNELRDEYKKHAREYLNWCNNVIIGKFDESYKWVLDIIKNLEAYIKRINQLDNEGKLTNSKDDIMAAIFHMFSNRFVGNNSWERKIHVLTRHSLHAFNQFVSNNKVNNHE